MTIENDHTGPEEDDPPVVKVTNPERDPDELQLRRMEIVETKDHRRTAPYDTAPGIPYDPNDEVFGFNPDGATIHDISEARSYGKQSGENPEHLPAG